MTYTLNIAHVYLSATESEISEGMAWYDEARALATEWGNGDVWKGAGVIAAYSPLTPWYRNMELAKDSLITGVARTDTLGVNWRKAQAILNGAEPLAVLNGPKTVPFASAIANPDNTLITVDSHAYSIAVGKWHSTKNAKFGIRIRRDIQAAYLDVADMVGVTPNQIQAITWVTWRRMYPNKAAQPKEVIV